MSLSDTARMICVTVQAELDAQNHDYETNVSIFQYLAQQEVTREQEKGYVSANAGPTLFREQNLVARQEDDEVEKFVEQTTNIPSVKRLRSKGRTRRYTEITRHAQNTGGLRPRAWFAFKNRTV